MGEGFNPKSLANLTDHHFKKGNPGGPGRPKGMRSIVDIFRYLLEIELKMKHPATGQVEDVTSREAMAIALLGKAIKGDVSAFKEIRELTEGKVAQPLNLQGGESPVEVVIKTPVDISVRELAERILMQ